jgi:ribose-phosphate pyrophosphokinase
MAARFRQRLDWQEAVVVSPDAGGVARATEIRDQLKKGLQQVIARDEMAIAFKRRTPKGEPSVIDMVGDVRDRPAVIYDDMIQSGGTLLQVVSRLLDRGASEVHAAAVHADFTPGALGNLKDSQLMTLALSDTTSSVQGMEDGPVEIVTSARILAQAIWRIHTQQSVGWIFETLRGEGKLPPIQHEA